MHNIPDELIRHISSFTPIYYLRQVNKRIYDLISNNRHISIVIYNSIPDLYNNKNIDVIELFTFITVDTYKKINFNNLLFGQTDIDVSNHLFCAHYCGNVNLLQYLGNNIYRYYPKDTLNIIIKQYTEYECISNNVFAALSSTSNYRSMKYLLSVQHIDKVSLSRAMLEAIFRQDLTIICYLNQYIEISPSDVQLIINRRYYKLLLTLLIKYPKLVKYITRDLIKQLICYNAIDFIKYLISIGHPMRKAVNTAARYGHLELVKYLYTYSYSKHAMRYAAGYGHLDVVKYLYSINAPSINAARYAAGHGDVTMLKYLHSVGITDVNEIYYAMYRCNYDVIDYLLSINSYVLTNEQIKQLTYTECEKYFISQVLSTGINQRYLLHALFEHTYDRFRYFLDISDNNIPLIITLTQLQDIENIIYCNKILPIEHI